MVNDQDSGEREVIGAVEETPIILNGHSNGKPVEPAEVPQNPVVKLQLVEPPAISMVVTKPAVQIIVQPIPKIETLKGRVNSKPGEVIYLWGNYGDKERYVRIAGFSQACSFNKIVLSFENPLYEDSELKQARLNFFRADTTFHLNYLHGYEMIKFQSNKAESARGMLEKICFGDLIALHNSENSSRHGNVCGFVVNYDSKYMFLSHQDPFCRASGDSANYHFVEQARGLADVAYKISDFTKVEILKTRKDFDEELKKKEEPKAKAEEKK